MKFSKRQSVIYCTSVIMGLSVSAVADPSQPTPGTVGFTPQADNSTAPGIDQFTVAQRITLDTIPATDPLLTKAMDASNIDIAAKWLGYNGSFYGTVTKVYVTPDKREIMLDFNPDYHKAVCALLKLAAYSQFPDMRSLQGKRVLISGRWVAHKNQPVIQLFKPSQIKIVQEAAATKPVPAAQPNPASAATPPVTTVAATTPQN